MTALSHSARAHRGSPSGRFWPRNRLLLTAFALLISLAVFSNGVVATWNCEDNPGAAFKSPQPRAGTGNINRFCDFSKRQGGLQYPCGSHAFGSGTKTELTGGSRQQITVDVAHLPDDNNSFRVAFSCGDDSHFDEHILATYFSAKSNFGGLSPTQPSRPTPWTYTFEIDVPNINEENCALQLVYFHSTTECQFPANSVPGSSRPTCDAYYVSCADVSIKGGDFSGDEWIWNNPAPETYHHQPSDWVKNSNSDGFNWGVPSVPGMQGSLALNPNRPDPPSSLEKIIGYAMVVVIPVVGLFFICYRWCLVPWKKKIGWYTGLTAWEDEENADSGDEENARLREENKLASQPLRHEERAREAAERMKRARENVVHGAGDPNSGGYVDASSGQSLNAQYRFSTLQEEEADVIEEDYNDRRRQAPLLQSGGDIESRIRNSFEDEDDDLSDAAAHQVNLVPVGGVEDERISQEMDIVDDLPNGQNSM